MTKRTVYTEISPLPPNISRETVLNFLHDHLGMIDLNPLVKERHPIPAPADAAPEEKQLNWYSLTDKIAYLPGGLATGDISYTAVFNDLPNGLQTHCWAPLGVEIRSRWTLNGTLPGETPERAEIGIGAPATGLYIREDVDLRCNLLMAGFIKKTTKKAHQTLVDHLAAKAQAAADLDATAAAAVTPGSTAMRGHNAARFSDYSQVRSVQGPPPFHGGDQQRDPRGRQDGWRAHGYSSSDGDVKKLVSAAGELPPPFSSASEFRPFMTPAAPQPQRFSAMPPPLLNSTAPLPSKQHFSPRQPAYQEASLQGPPLPSFLLPPRPPASQNPSRGTQRQSLDSAKERLYVPYSPSYSSSTRAPLASLYPPSPSTSSSADSEEDYLGDGECVGRTTLYPNPLCIQRPPAGRGGGGFVAGGLTPSPPPASGTPAMPLSAMYPEMSPYSSDPEDSDTCGDPRDLGLYGMHPAPLRPGLGQHLREARLEVDVDAVPAALRPGSSPTVDFGSSWRDLR